MNNESEIKLELLKMTAKVVSALVKSGQKNENDVDELIESIYAKFSDVYTRGGDVTTQRPNPAVPIEDSIAEDHITCLEDGKKMKMMRRYIMRNYGLTPEEYRERWGLPSDYPMTAPSYSKKRSRLAKDIGLGVNK